MSDHKGIQLIYDNECPACRYYCQLARIRETAGPLTLIDARDGGPVVQEITAAGLDIDQGMVLKLGDELYYGADAIHMLSLLSSRAGVFNRLTYRVFQSRRVSRVLYPLLRSCRNLLLRVLGKTKINNLEKDNNSKF